MITGNEPAMPMKDVAFHAESNDVAFGSSNSDFKANFKGLTIRQHFAAMAMASDDYQGMSSEAYLIRAKENWLSKADALIKALNDEQ